MDPQHRVLLLVGVGIGLIVGGVFSIVWELMQ